MKASEFKSFIENNGIEWHRHKNDGEEDIIIFPEFNDLEEFTKILGYGYFDEEGLECYMKDGYMAIWCRDLLESSGIGLDEIFEKSKNNWDD